jgi:hypothetical protein
VRLSVGFDGNDGAALVLSALLASAVRELLFAAVGAIGSSGGGEEVVAATLGGTLLGVAALRIRHGETSSRAERTRALWPKSW